MKIAIIETQVLKNGVKEIAEKYGPSAVILRSSDLRKESSLVIGYSEGEKTNLKNRIALKTIATNNDFHAKTHSLVEKNSNKIKQESTKKKSFKNIDDIIKEEITLLSSEDHGPISPNLLHKDSSDTLKNDFFEILQETPTSRRLKSVLYQSIAAPINKLELLKQLKKAILKEIPKTLEINPSDQLHVITGGYGAGKTSIALKMASQLGEATGKRASVITFKENESEPPKVVPQAEVRALFANNLNELAELLKKKSKNEITIIDLATGNAAAGIKAIRKIRPDANFHLVSPTDSCISSIRDNCENHSWNSLIFTRLDSKAAPWAALEALSEFKIPLSIGSTSDQLSKKLVLVSGDNIAQRIIEYFDCNIKCSENNAATDSPTMPFAALH